VLPGILFEWIREFHKSYEELVYLEMDTLIVYPANEEQMAALKEVMETMKIPFEQKKEVYPDHVTDGLKKSSKEVGEGKSKPYTGIKDMLGPK
jgi:hypothetical protein